MKTKFFAFLLIAILTIGLASQAQAQQNVIKLNPLSLAVLTGNVQYERAINNAMSVQLGFFYTGFGFDVGDGRWSYSGIGLTPEFRYYVTNSAKDAPRGLYVGPWVRYQNFSTKIEDNISNEEGKISVNSIGGGGILGYQWLFGDAFALDLFMGPGFTSGTAKVVSGSADVDELRGIGSGTGVAFRFGIAIGAAL